MDKYERILLNNLYRTWLQSTFYTGNDLDKVKTEAYHTCAKELDVVLMALEEREKRHG